MNGLKLQRDLNSSVFSTGNECLDHSEYETTIGTVSRQPDSCKFLTIARELRDIIYIDLIISGNLAILRASGQFHDEAKELLYRHGTCRLAFEYKTDPKLLNTFRTPPGHKAQNLNILIFLDRRSVDHGPVLAKHMELGRDFVLSVQHPSVCHVTLVYLKDCWPSCPPLPTPLSDFIKSLSKFKLVTLRFHLVSYYHPMDRRNLKGGPKHNILLQTATDLLAVEFGQPERKLDTGPSARYQTSEYAKTPQLVNPFPIAQYLEFRPFLRLDFLEDVQQDASGVIHHLEGNRMLCWDD